MLKFDRLGPGEKVNPNGYAALLNDAKDLTATLTLKSGATANGNVSLRNVGTGVVAEGHFAYKAEADESSEVMAIPVAGCKIDVSGVLEFVVPEGKTTLDVSHLIPSLVTNDLDLTKSDNAAATAAAGVITVTSAPEKGSGGAKIVLKPLVVATGTATTDNNAATVNLDPGDYQVHFIARAYDTVDGTRMPNPTMMEFVKHCRPLNIRW